jgi:hypothetical protein
VGQLKGGRVGITWVVFLAGTPSAGDFVWKLKPGAVTTAIGSATIPPCGTVLASGKEWLGGAGVDANPKR